VGESKDEGIHTSKAVRRLVCKRSNRVACVGACERVGCYPPWLRVPAVLGLGGVVRKVGFVDVVVGEGKWLLLLLLRGTRVPGEQA